MEADCRRQLVALVCAAFSDGKQEVKKDGVAAEKAESARLTHFAVRAGGELGVKF